MIIDSHHHLWRFSKKDYAWITPQMKNIARNFTLNDAKSIMQAENVVGSILVQVRQNLEETQDMLNIANSDDFIRGVVGWVNLESPKLHEQLTLLTQDPKLVGIRHIVQDESDNEHLLRPAFMHGLQSLTHTHLCYDILIYERQLKSALTMMQHIPALPCVIDHIAKPNITCPPSQYWKEYMAAIANETSAFCKLSGMVTQIQKETKESFAPNWDYDTFAPYLEHLFNCFGENRLMFGSDWPVCLLKANYGQVKFIIETFITRHCPNAAEKIWHKNALDFYNIKNDT